MFPMDHDKAIKELESLFAEYRVSPIPKGGGQVVELDDADIDLYEEDGYLAGLVSTYLTTGKVSVQEIQLNGTIDARIEKARMTSPHTETIDEFLTYRKRMFELATALNRISGVPLRIEGRN